MIGRLIKEYLEKEGIKQNVVAEKVGISANTMSDICSEKRKTIDCIEYYKICKVLGVPLNYFLEDVTL